MVHGVQNTSYDVHDYMRLQIPSLLVNRCLQNAIDQQYMYSSQVML